MLPYEAYKCPINIFDSWLQKLATQSLCGTTWESIQPEVTSILNIQPMPNPMLSQDQQAEIFAGYKAQIDAWVTFLYKYCFPLTYLSIYISLIIYII